MQQRRLSSLISGKKSSGATEFALLAQEVRNRERLVVSSSTPPPSRLQPGTSPTKTQRAWSTGETTGETTASSRVTAAAAGGAKRTVHEVKPQRSEVSYLQEDRRHRRVWDDDDKPSECPRTGSSPNKGTRSTWAGKKKKSTHQRHKNGCAASYGHRRGAGRRRNNSHSTETNSEKGTYEDQHCRYDHDTPFDPGVEAKMLSVFRGDGQTKRGVDVRAILSLYRKRHEQEKAKALDEVRRWWRLGRSEEVPLAEAMAASILLGASEVEDTTNGRTAGATGGSGAFTRLHERHRASAIGHPETTFGDETLDPKTPGDDTSRVSISRANSPREKKRNTRKLNNHHSGGHEQPLRCAFDGMQYSVDWRQVQQDPSYMAGVVREIKTALRSGQSVQMRSRGHHLEEEQQEGESSIGRTSCWVDCQLMLRNLYMRCVPVSSRVQ